MLRLLQWMALALVVLGFAWDLRSADTSATLRALATAARQRPHPHAANWTGAEERLKISADEGLVLRAPSSVVPCEKMPRCDKCASKGGRCGWCADASSGGTGGGGGGTGGGGGGGSVCLRVEAAAKCQSPRVWIGTSCDSAAEIGLPSDALKARSVRSGSGGSGRGGNGGNGGGGGGGGGSTSDVEFSTLAKDGNLVVRPKPIDDGTLVNVVKNEIVSNDGLLTPLASNLADAPLDELPFYWRNLRRDEAEYVIERATRQQESNETRWLLRPAGSDASALVVTRRVYLANKARFQTWHMLLQLLDNGTWLLKAKNKTIDGLRDLHEALNGKPLLRPGYEEESLEAQTTTSTTPAMTSTRTTTTTTTTNDITSSSSSSSSSSFSSSSSTTTSSPTTMTTTAISSSSPSKTAALEVANTNTQPSALLSSVGDSSGGTEEDSVDDDGDEGDDDDRSAPSNTAELLAMEEARLHRLEAELQRAKAREEQRRASTLTNSAARSMPLSAAASSSTMSNIQTEATAAATATTTTTTTTTIIMNASNSNNTMESRSNAPSIRVNISESATLASTTSPVVTAATTRSPIESIPVQQSAVNDTFAVAGRQQHQQQHESAPRIAEGPPTAMSSTNTGGARKSEDLSMSSVSSALSTDAPAFSTTRNTAKARNGTNPSATRSSIATSTSQIPPTTIRTTIAATTTVPFTTTTTTTTATTTTTTPMSTTTKIRTIPSHFNRFSCDLCELKGFGQVVGYRWCWCCTSNCGGFQRDCIEQENLCVEPSGTCLNMGRSLSPLGDNSTFCERMHAAAAAQSAWLTESLSQAKELGVSFDRKPPPEAVLASSVAETMRQVNGSTIAPQAPRDARRGESGAGVRVDAGTAVEQRKVASHVPSYIELYNRRPPPFSVSEDTECHAESEHDGSSNTPPCLRRPRNGTVPHLGTFERAQFDHRSYISSLPRPPQAPYKLSQTLIVSWCDEGLGWIRTEGLTEMDTVIYCKCKRCGGKQFNDTCPQPRLPYWRDASPDVDGVRSFPSSVARFTKLGNCGYEVYAYLTYIVDYYENLADVMYFVQGNPMRHAPHLGATIRALDKRKLDFVPLSYLYVGMNATCSPTMPCGPHLNNTMQTLYGYNAPNVIGFYCCGQFAVSRRAVRARPLSFWKRILHMVDGTQPPMVEGDKLMRTESGVFEVLWSTFFGEDPRMRSLTPITARWNWWGLHGINPLTYLTANELKANISDKAALVEV